MALIDLWDKVMCMFHCIFTGKELYSSIQHFEHKGKKEKTILYFYSLSGWQAAVKLHGPFKRNAFYSEMVNADKDQKFC